jgi:hypothetical protein
MTESEKLSIKMTAMIERRKDLLVDLVKQVAELEVLRDRLIEARDRGDILDLIESINKYGLN